MRNDTDTIYLAITRQKKRLVISGSFELYAEFMQTVLRIGEIYPTQSTQFQITTEEPQEEEEYE